MDFVTFSSEGRITKSSLQTFTHKFSVKNTQPNVVKLMISEQVPLSTDERMKVSIWVCENLLYKYEAGVEDVLDLSGKTCYTLHTLLVHIAMVTSPIIILGYCNGHQATLMFYFVDEVCYFFIFVWWQTLSDGSSTCFGHWAKLVLMVTCTFSWLTWWHDTPKLTHG